MLEWDWCALWLLRGLGAGKPEPQGKLETAPLWVEVMAEKRLRGSPVLGFSAQQGGGRSCCLLPSSAVLRLETCKDGSESLHTLPETRMLFRRGLGRVSHKSEQQVGLLALLFWKKSDSGLFWVQRQDGWASWRRRGCPLPWGCGLQGP